MTRDLRVLMTADTVGGVWTYACELIAALRPLGVEVTLATMGAPLSVSQARTAAALPHVEVFESTFALEWMPEPWRDVNAAGYWLLALEQLTRPDVKRPEVEILRRPGCRRDGLGPWLRDPIDRREHRGHRRELDVTRGVELDTLQTHWQFLADATTTTNARRPSCAS